MLFPCRKASLNFLIVLTALSLYERRLSINILKNSDIVNYNMNPVYIVRLCRDKEFRVVQEFRRSIFEE